MLISKIQDGYTLKDSTLKGWIGKGLSIQEIKLLLLRAVGMTAKESSREMNCSPATTNKRQQNINFKLNAKNATQAVSVAFQKGIITHLILIICLGATLSHEKAEDRTRLRSPRVSTRVQARREVLS